MPAVTLAVSSYNQLDFLKIALASATEQSRPFDEIFVIDDASTDGSADFLKDWEKQADNRRVICLPENVGRGEVRNITLREMRTEYMASLDGDDWLELDAMQQIGDVLDNDAPDALIYDNHVYLDAENRRVDRIHANPFYSKEVYRKGKLRSAQDRLGLFRIVPPNWQKVLRVSFLQENNFHCAFPTFEDIVWHHQIAVQARDIICIDKPLVTYRLHSNSALGSCSAEHMCLMDVVDASARIMEHSNPDPLLLAGSHRYCFHMMCNTLLNSPRIPEELKQEFARKALDRCARMPFDMDEREQEMLAKVTDVAALATVG